MTPFELSPTLMGQIRTAMENQEQIFVLDGETLQVVPASEVDLDGDPDRYFALPVWTSLQGYGLMEGFTTSLHNPLMKQQLHGILKSGKGVFRQFKQTLKEYPAMEHLWLRFKDSKMKQHIVSWYNDYREFWGMARLADEFQEDESPLVLEDFSPVPITRLSSEELSSLALSVYHELWVDPDLAAWHLGQCSLETTLDPRASLCIETVDQEVAGIIAFSQATVGHGKKLNNVVLLWVAPLFRGIGLGSHLIKLGTQRALDAQAQWIVVNMPMVYPWQTRMFEHHDYNRHGAYLIRKR